MRGVREGENVALRTAVVGGGLGGMATAVALAQAGIGVDYRIQARLSFRVEGDWVYTDYFSQTQNNFQGVAGAVLHF